MPVTRSADVALATLYARALVGFTREYGTHEGTPPLALWSNLLRCVTEEGVPFRELPRLARLSRRAISPLVTAGAVAGLVETRGEGRNTVVVLTGSGSTARVTGHDALQLTEGVWKDRDDELVPRLRRELENLVGQFDLELPHYPLGYGAVDTSITGGQFRPASQLGVPFIPAHGKDWRPVVRDGPATADSLPLSALLSQALVAFAIEYELEGRATLPLAAELQAIGDEGLPLAYLPQGVDLCPTRLPRLQAAKILVVERAEQEDNKIVRLTEPAMIIRDSYGSVCAAIESGWQERYGGELIRSLRASVETVASELGADLSPYPVVSWVGGFLEASERSRR